MARTYQKLDPKVAKRIAKNIQTLRKERGLTKYALGNQAGLAQGYLTHIEAGRIANPTLSTLLRVSKALKVTPSQLTGLQL
jgi:transcriptional regulator with XRE-family HTH domain